MAREDDRLDGLLDEAELRGWLEYGYRESYDSEAFLISAWEGMCENRPICTIAKLARTYAIVRIKRNSKYDLDSITKKERDTVAQLLGKRGKLDGSQDWGYTMHIYRVCITDVPTVVGIVRAVLGGES